MATRYSLAETLCTWSTLHSGCPGSAPQHSRWWSEPPPLLFWWKSWRSSLQPGCTGAGASTGLTAPPLGAARTRSRRYLQQAHSQLHVLTHPLVWFCIWFTRAPRFFQTVWRTNPKTGQYLHLIYISIYIAALHSSHWTVRLPYM